LKQRRQATESVIPKLHSHASHPSAMLDLSTAKQPSTIPAFRICESEEASQHQDLEQAAANAAMILAEARGHAITIGLHQTASRNGPGLTFVMNSRHCSGLQ
jgi:hypothetical protein